MPRAFDALLVLLALTACGETEAPAATGRLIEVDVSSDSFQVRGAEQANTIDVQAQEQLLIALEGEQGSVPTLSIPDMDVMHVAVDANARLSLRAWPCTDECVYDVLVHPRVGARGIRGLLRVRGAEAGEAGAVLD